MKKTAAVATFLALVTILVGGCGGGGAEPPESDVPPRSYEMRGMVRQISPADAEERQIWIHHEAIPEFVDIRGNAAPMDAMTMPFHLTESVDLSEVEPGDKVSFRLDVDWGASVPARIGSLEVLEPGTPLTFEESETEPVTEEPAEDAADHGDH